MTTKEDCTSTGHNRVPVLPSEPIDEANPADDNHFKAERNLSPTTISVEKEPVKRHTSMLEDSGREKLKRHRREVAGRVWIPEMWGQEKFLKDWIDCSAFSASIRSAKLMSARAALVEEGRRANSVGLRVENRC